MWKLWQTADYNGQSKTSGRMAARFALRFIAGVCDKCTQIAENNRRGNAGRCAGDASGQCADQSFFRDGFLYAFGQRITEAGQRCGGS